MTRICRPVWPRGGRSPFLEASPGDAMAQRAKQRNKVQIRRVISSVLSQRGLHACNIGLEPARSVTSLKITLI